MYYEINIALKGKHFIATSSRSIQDIAKLNEVFAVLNSKFPESEGYTLTIAYVLKKRYAANRYIYVNALKSGKKHDVFKLFKD